MVFDARPDSAGWTTLVERWAWALEKLEEEFIKKETVSSVVWKQFNHKSDVNRTSMIYKLCQKPKKTTHQICSTASKQQEELMDRC